MSEASAPDFDDVADELYGLPPEEFTATRNAYQKQAKQAGEPDVARRIHALTKPTVTAWLANQLARQHEDELRPLLELGAGLREATRTLAGDQLRQLSRQQHELVYALVQQARHLARDAGRNINDDAARGLEDTLRAALADTQAADLLMAGRLTEALHHDGFGPMAEPGGHPVTPPNRASGGSDQGAEQREQVERELADAERAVAAADTVRNDAQSRLTQAEQAVADASLHVEVLRRRLDAAVGTRSRAEQQRVANVAVLEKAEGSLNDAQAHLAKAQTSLDELGS